MAFHWQDNCGCVKLRVELFAETVLNFQVTKKSKSYFGRSCPQMYYDRYLFYNKREKTFGAIVFSKNLLRNVTPDQGKL